MKDVEHVVSPYHDCQVIKKLNIILLILLPNFLNPILNWFLKDPEKEIKKMMTSIGFRNIAVHCTEKSYTYIGLEAIKSK